MLNHSIQIVLVLYKTKLEDSLSYKTLREHISVLSCSYELLVYNNSPEITIEEKENYVVVNAKQNEMLAGAYSYALQRAVKYGRNWLLLLDQDTCLSKEYFEQLNKALQHENVAAILPKLRYKQVHLSPKSCNSFIGHWGKMRNIQAEGIIQNKTIQAFNSAALIKTDSLQKIGGFSAEFPLYELDYWVFFQLSKNKEQFYLVDVTLYHDLTMLDYENKMTAPRYASIIEAEHKFSKQIGLLAIFAFKGRLIFRLLKQLFVKEKRPYRHLTLKYLLK
jgi:hypothetical protein